MLQRIIRVVDQHDKVAKDHSLVLQPACFREENRMTIQARHVGSRLLLIVALAVTLLAGMVAVQWAMSQNASAHTFITAIGGDQGGGRIRSVASLGGDSGGGRHRDSGGISPSSLGGDSGG